MFMRPTRLTVSHGAYRRNYERLAKELAKGKSKIMAVVKADGYGLGMLKVSRWLKEFGVDFFAVATPDEAEALREDGLKEPILVFGASPYDAAEYYAKEDIRATIADYEFAKKLSQSAVRLGKTAKVHMKVDTGMGRIGFLCEEYPEIAEKVAALPGIEIEGVFTHFSTSDEADLTWTHEQHKKFSRALAAIKSKGINIKIAHCCNSGAILAGLTDYYGDYARPGAIVHGITPNSECASGVKIERSFSLKTAVSVVRDLPENWPVCYGRTYYTRAGERTAVLPIGYADGFPRSLSNKGEVLIRGQRCPIIGRVCMDQCVAAVGHLADVAVGDEVVLIGKQGGEEISEVEFAERAGMIAGSVMTGLTARVPRVYAEEL